MNSKKAPGHGVVTRNMLFSLILLLVALFLVSCSQTKPEPTLRPMPTIVPRTKAPDSLNASPAIGIGFDVDVTGYVQRKEHGLGAAVEYDDDYIINYIPNDKTYLFEIRLPQNFSTGTYPVKQGMFMDSGTLYVPFPEEIAVMFLLIPSEDRSYDDIAFDRGTYFGSNVSGSVTVSSTKPFSGMLNFSGQDEQGDTVTISGHFTGS